MPDTISLKDTDVWTITIARLNPTTKAFDPFPPGTTFSAPSPSPAIATAIGTDANGNPALVVNALTLPSANTMGMLVQVSDSAGDVADELTVNYPVPPLPDDVVLDVSTAVITTQAAPTTPGP